MYNNVYNLMGFTCFTLTLDVLHVVIDFPPEYCQL